MANKVKLNWIQMSSDNVFKISTADQTPSDEGSIYFSGSTPAGEFTFGIAGHDNAFIPFPNGNFNISKTIKHGYGVVILCKVVGLTGSGKIVYVAYAGRN